MATLATFRTEVSSVLGLDTGNASELALVDQWLNEGVVDLVLRTQCKVLPATMTLTASTDDYTLPTEILSIVEMYVTSGSTKYALERVTPAEMLGLRQVDYSTSDSPIRYYAVDGANLLMVYPTPSAADTINLLYVPRPTTLSVTSDSPSEIPSEWHKLVAFYALWRGADYDDDSTSGMGERYLQLYEIGQREMRRALSRKGGHRPAPLRVNRRRRSIVAHDPSADVG